MAKKRMFDKSVIETDNFLNISMSAKALYFLLGMEADDEGFISPTRVLRLYGGEMGDIKNLIDVGLVIPFKSGVVVITNWNQNNYLDKNRITVTKYQEEKGMLMLTEQGLYELNKRSANVQPVENSRVENRVVESSKSKDKYGEFNNVLLTKDERVKLVERFSEKNTVILIEELSGYLASKQKRYASHYATILNWGRRKIQEHNSKTTKVGKL